jgi:uncharacterized protein
MKILFVVLAVVALLWLLRGARRRVAPPPSAKPPTPPPDAPLQMLACAHCGVHMPRGEALPGRGGVFCGEAHRAAFEEAHPGS